MKKLLYFFIFTTLAVISSSCHKQNDEVMAAASDKFIGNYSGTKTTLVDADNVLISYTEGATTKTIEKGVDDNDIIIGKGTDLEFHATVDGTSFQIPGQVTSFLLEKQGIAIDVSILGQGILNAENELTITYTGTDTYEKTVYKWTIVEKLTKSTEPNP
jgi:hypothetical protein